MGMNNLAKLKSAVSNSPRPMPAGLNAIVSAYVAAQPTPQVNQYQQAYQSTPHYKNMQKIQEQIKVERNLQGLTQRDLAAKAGMSQGTITRAERHGWISITCLLRIAAALGKEIKLT